MNILKKVGLGLITAAALLSPNLTKANPPFFVMMGTHHNQYEPHYSPYAFGYHNNGLVSGTTTYSPYALGYKNPGLVDENTRYSPYALSYSNSGLVPNSYSHYPQKPLEMIVDPGPGNYPLVIPRNQASPPRINPQNIPPAQEDAAKQKRKEDGKYLILSWLRERNFSDFNIDRGFSTNAGTISTNFISFSRKIIINYQDKEEIGRLKDIQKKMCDKYSSDLEVYLAQKSQEGFKIFRMTQEDKKFIKNRLENILK